MKIPHMSMQIILHYQSEGQDIERIYCPTVVRPALVQPAFIFRNLYVKTID
jgi:hypothetical protein